MENIVLKASHLKHLKICYDSEKQNISVLLVRIHGQMNHWIREMLHLTPSVFSTYNDTYYVYEVVFVLLALFETSS